MKLIFLLVIFGLFILSCSAQKKERDILELAAKNSGGREVKGADGVYRMAKYGDYQLEKAVEQLRNYHAPFTVPRVISWYRKSKDNKIRASLLRVLAVSRDARAAIILGNSLKDESLDVRIAATYGLLDYFINSGASGGTEQHMIYVQNWWKKNRERLKNEATGRIRKIKSND